MERCRAEVHCWNQEILLLPIPLRLPVCPVFAMTLLALAAHGGTLQDSLKARIGDFQGKVSLYAKNAATGAAADIRGSEPVRTASTIKLPILCSVFDAVARGQAKWSDLLTVTPAER